MVPHSRAPVRADRLRALNVPRRVEVELDARGEPVAVREIDEPGESGRGGSRPAQLRHPTAAEAADGPEPPHAAAPAASAAVERWGGVGLPPSGVAAGTGAAGWRGRRVVEILEIWRIDDEWWRRPISRRYVDVVLEGGGHVVLFEDLTTNEWFLQKP